MKEKYSWEQVFDYVKDRYPEVCVVKIRSKNRYVEPSTPRTQKGFANVYAKYDVESDSIIIWAYTGKNESIHDPYDGSWGQWTQREKIQGRRTLNGDWIEPLMKLWEND